MLDPDRYRLLFGPYRTPRVRLGDVLPDEVRDCDVVVIGITDAKIPWPIGKPKGGRARSPIVCGALADAVRRESRLAVCHWWGVTGQTVTKWRKALGVAVTNEGTRRLRSEYFEEDWAVEARKKAYAKSGDPARRAKIAAAKRGKPRPWKVIARLIEAKSGTKHTQETRAKMSATHKRRGTRVPNGHRAWTAEEDEAVRKLPVGKAVIATGRSLSAVYSRRHELGKCSV